MKDALGKDLKFGQKVAIPCNSKFKVGILYGYKPNRGKWYLEMVDYVARRASGQVEDIATDWRAGYYTQERVDEQAYKYYIRFADGKKRVMTQRASIIGLPDDSEIQL